MDYLSESQIDYVKGAVILKTHLSSVVFIWFGIALLSSYDDCTPTETLWIPNTATKSKPLNSAEPTVTAVQR